MFRPCVLIPTFNNPTTVGAVVRGARAYLEQVIVVDDGSTEAGRTAVAALAQENLAVVHTRPKNGGKGAAVKTGFRLAYDLGFSHALQVDADGQHALADIPRFLAAACQSPDALVLGAPQFDGSAPLARRIGRRFTRFWTHLETGGRVAVDPLCGFRVYPLRAALAVSTTGDRMDFDPEIVVRMVWAGTPVVNLPTQVRYLRPEQGGVSHFRLLEDNLRITWMHTRLVTGRVLRGLARRTRTQP